MPLTSWGSERCARRSAIEDALRQRVSRRGERDGQNMYCVINVSEGWEDSSFTMRLDYAERGENGENMPAIITALIVLLSSRTTAASVEAQFEGSPYDAEYVGICHFVGPFGEFLYEDVPTSELLRNQYVDRNIIPAPSWGCPQGHYVYGLHGEFGAEGTEAVCLRLGEPIALPTLHWMSPWAIQNWE